eukprot:401963_1
MTPLNCVTVGDTGVGKTSLLIEYTTNAVPWDYIPTTFDDYSANVMVDGKPYMLKLIDTFADHDVAIRRAELYSKADIILILFDVMNRDTFYNVKSKWKKEIDLHCPNTPYILCGNKHWDRNEFYKDKGILDTAQNKHDYLDHKTSMHVIYGYIHKYSIRYQLIVPDDLINICYEYYYFVSTPVSKQEGMEMMKQIGAKQYVEHALLAQDCKMVFDETIREAVKHILPLTKKRNCKIL